MQIEKNQGNVLSEWFNNLVDIRKLMIDGQNNFYFQIGTNLSIYDENHTLIKTLSNVIDFDLERSSNLVYLQSGDSLCFLENPADSGTCNNLNQGTIWNSIRFNAAGDGYFLGSNETGLTHFSNTLQPVWSNGDLLIESLFSSVNGSVVQFENGGSNIEVIYNTGAAKCSKYIESAIAGPSAVHTSSNSIFTFDTQGGFHKYNLTDCSHFWSINFSSPINGIAPLPSPNLGN